MKNIVFIIFSTFFLLSCSRDIPQDIHEHEEPNRLVITYSEENSSVIKVAEFNVGTGTTAAIDLENGKTYNVEVAFFHDTEDLTSEIITEKEEHFMEYQFSAIDISITRTTNDPEREDGNKLGLYMKWMVNSAPTTNSSVKVQLIHDADSVDDSANNGGGSSQGGEPDVDVNFMIE